MTPTILKQLQIIKRIWVAYKPVTDEQKAQKKEMLNMLNDGIAQVLAEMTAFEDADIREGVSPESLIQEIA